jgi:ribokinase
VKSIDSTAAGDCFVAAVTHFWEQGNDLKVAVAEAVNVAALSVTMEGAQTSLPTLKEYLQFKQQLGVNAYGIANPSYERNK